MGIDAGQQLRRKKFWEQHEVGTVVRSGVQEKFALLSKLVKAVDFSHLVLNHADSNFLNRRLESPFGARDVVQIFPLQERGVTTGLVVGGKIVGDQAFDGEPV